MERREKMQERVNFVQTFVLEIMLKPPRLNVLPPIKPVFPIARSLTKMLSQTGIQLQLLSVGELSTSRAYASRSTSIFDCRACWQNCF